MGRIDDPDAFETRLRAALGSGAATVEPDPRTFAYTRRRHRRRCLLRQTSVGAVIAGVIALALLAGPGLSMRPDVTFPAAEQPPPLPPPAPAPRPPDGPMAPPMGPEPESATAGAPLVVAAPSGEVRVLVPGGPPEMPYLPVPAAELPSPPCASGAEPCDKTVTDLAVRPGSTPERLVYATRQVLPDRCLADIALFDVEVRSGGSGGAHDVIGVDGCPTAPVWSPDGAYVAWAEGQSVTIVRWEGVDITGVEADAVPVEGLPKLTDLELVSWLPNDGAGSLFVRGAHEDGGIGYTTVPIERDGAAHRLRADAATRLPPGTLGLQSGGAGGDGFPRAVSLQSIQDDTGATSSISLFSGEGREPQTIELEFGLMDPSDPEGRHVWLTSTDGVVLFGDGVDDAWVTEVTDQGLGEPVPLGLPVRAGGVLEPGAIPPSMEDDLAPDPSAPAPAEPPAGVVLVEPTGVRVSTPGGAPVSPALTCAGPSDCGDVVRIALRPGSTAERYDVATHHVQGDRCISGVALGRGRAAPATELSLTRFAGADFGPPNPCVGAPAWSADGRYVAWIDREALSTAGWDDEAGTAVDGISGGPLGPMAGFREARVERWVWERERLRGRPPRAARHGSW